MVMDSSIFDRKIYRIAVVEQSRKFAEATNRGPKRGRVPRPP